MTTYHRYILANGTSTTLDQVCAALRAASAVIELDREVVLRNGRECGIVIDVTRRGDPIFEDDLLVISERLGSSGPTASHAQRVLKAAWCMVTVQLTHDADESVLDLIWTTLRSHRPGILVMEGSDSAIRYDE